jgi:hypothetical protein
VATATGIAVRKNKQLKMERNLPAKAATRPTGLRTVAGHSETHAFDGTATFYPHEKRVKNITRITFATR